MCVLKEHSHFLQTFDFLSKVHVAVAETDIQYNLGNITIEYLFL